MEHPQVAAHVETSAFKEVSMQLEPECQVVGASNKPDVSLQLLLQTKPEADVSPC